VLENAALADRTPPSSLSPEELDVFRRVREVFNESYKIHWTGCGYCMPCPRNVNIPGAFAAYNASYSLGRIIGWHQYVTSAAFLSEQSFGPVNCIACGTCEQRCPQKLSIIAGLEAVRRRMEVPVFRAALAVLRIIRDRV
jgi:predicted aldo/keto reductase-like oxidoreductase